MRKLYHFGAKLSPFRHRALLLAMLSGVLVTSLPASASDDVTLNISGTLRKTSCQLDSDSTIINIDFPTINSRDLDFSDSLVKEFQVLLTKCDLSGNDIKVTITGDEYGNTGFLALDKNSVAKGFAIGFKAGQVSSMINLNLGQEYKVRNNGGDMTLHFGAYLKKMSTLVTGNFKASAKLSIVYQ